MSLNAALSQHSEEAVSVVVDSTQSPLFLLLVKLYSYPSSINLLLLINVPTSALNTSSTNAGSDLLLNILHLS